MSHTSKEFIKCRLDNFSILSTYFPHKKFLFIHVKLKLQITFINTFVQGNTKESFYDLKSDFIELFFLYTLLYNPTLNKVYMNQNLISLSSM